MKKKTKPAAVNKGGRPKASDERQIVPIRYSKTQVAAMQAIADLLEVPLSTYIREASLRAHPETAKLIGQLEASR